VRLEHLLSGVHEVATAEVNKKDTLVLLQEVRYQLHLFEILKRLKAKGHKPKAKARRPTRINWLQAQKATEKGL